VAAPVQVEQDRRAGRGEVPDVVGEVLEVPTQLAGLAVESDDGAGVQVVAGPDAAVEAGRRVADAEVQGPGGGVVGGGHPDGAAATFPGVTVGRAVLAFRHDVSAKGSPERVDVPPFAPPAVGGLSRRGDGVPAPDQLAGRGVVGADEPTQAVVRAADAHEDLPVEREGGHGEAVAVLGVGDLGVPDDLAGAAVQGDEAGIERGDVDVVTVDADAAVVGATAELRAPDFGLELPDLLARGRVQGDDAASRGGQVHDVPGDDGSRLE